MSEKCPISKHKGKIYWNNAPLNYDDFASIRQYIDDCIYFAGAKDHYYTNNSDLLIACVQQFRSLIPDIDVPKFPEFKPKTIPKFSAYVPKKKGVPEKKRQEMYIILRKKHAEKISHIKNINERNELEHKKKEKEFNETNRKIFKEIEVANFRKKVLRRLEDDLRHYSYNGYLIKLQKVNWVILPSGRIGFKKLMEYYSAFSIANPNRRLDLNRIKTIMSYKPIEIYVGENEFTGYSAFIFKNQKWTVLENPEIGNATYLIKGDWEYLSQQSKTVLLKYHSSKVQRIIHKGQWKLRLSKFFQKNNPYKLKIDCDSVAAK